MALLSQALQDEPRRQSLQRTRKVERLIVFTATAWWFVLLFADEDTAYTAHASVEEDRGSH